MFCVGFGSSLTASAAYNPVEFSVDLHTPTDSTSVLFGGSAVTLKSTTSSEPKLEFDILLPRNVLKSLSTDFYEFNIVAHNDVDDGNFICYVTYYDSFNTVIGNYTFVLSRLDQGSYSGVFSTLNRVSDVPARVHFSCSWSSGDSRYEQLMLSVNAVIQNSDGTQSIIQAINNQTSDLQQSIQDQYSGNPGSSFPVDDIITQHNSKMGVLSFGSDTLMQVLGLLSPDQSLSSELVFPSMSLTIVGQRNKVQLWPEYRFDLNELKQHWPDFVGIMQSLTTALVWIFVLRYCYRVFEKYFLAGGGN